MNYILSNLNKKIDFLKSDNQRAELRIHYQSKFEFILIYILSYLWNKNWETISIDDREYIINCIGKPSIGTIISMIRKLDLSSEFFGNRKVKGLYNFIDDYPRFRNEKIGHGFSFEDDTENYLNFFEKFFELIEAPNLHDIFNEVEIIKVTKEEDNTFKGISYKSDGFTYRVWSCPKQIFNFEVGDLFLFIKSTYYVRISPFILLENESEFYTFCSIEEKLTGRTKYNKLLKTGHSTIEVPEFEKLSILSDGSKRKSANGTVINAFQNNFSKYIDVGITKKIISFLENNMASVFGTIWGHGGVGKTASIQRVCEILCNQAKKVFDYVIFLSAKDRQYNYYHGRINHISDGITSLDDIIRVVNSIIFSYDDLNDRHILNYQGKLLIIIDDFETFSKEEKDRIIEFLNKLNINHHKIIITTRSAILITGEEIQTKELNEDECIMFLQEAIKNEIPNFNLDQLQRELRNKEIRKKVFEITSGRPLFILQLGIFAAQKGTLLEALNTEIKSTKETINFLYDEFMNTYLTMGKICF
ncbi:NB-ARC domain-containing protein [Flavobacterium sp. UBA7680]|uniref:NB-ARC domain-containing protein n=1 Tax=Flavobacterium sp. UBA7680 TaxID=1946559 RepID=UPI0025C31EDE|nr:NB-ARC domain-containing protein [Flavobacterium sp. UBA7680]